MVCVCGVPASLLASHQPLAPSKDGGLCAVDKMQLAEDVADVAFHRLFAEDEPLGDRGVAQPLGDWAQYFPLALTQLGEARHAMMRRAIQLLHETGGDMGMHHDLATRRFA